LRIVFGAVESSCGVIDCTLERGWGMVLDSLCDINPQAVSLLQ